MKKVLYTDKKGYTKRTLLPNDAGEEDARLGIPFGPPDIDQLDWEAIKREINQAIVRNELFTWEDVQASRFGVEAALLVLKRALIAAYREEWNNIRTVLEKRG